MKWFYDLKVGTKLLASFVVVAAVAGLIGWVGLSGMAESKTRSDGMYSQDLIPIRDLGYANAAFLIARTEVRNALAAKDKEDRREYVGLIEAETKKVDAYLAAFSKTELSKEEQEALSRFQSAFEQYKQSRGKAIDLLLNGQEAKAIAIIDGEARKTQAEARKELRALIDINARDAEADQKANAEAVAAARTKILIFIAVGVLLALGFGLLIARIIGNPLRAMQAAAGKLALGDVDVSVELDTRDELGALAQAFRAMAEVIKDRSGLAQRIAAGDLTVDVKPKSEQDVLGKSFLQVVETLRTLVAEAESLTQAAVAGKLATRGNGEQFQGGYRQIDRKSVV